MAFSEKGFSESCIEREKRRLRIRSGGVLSISFCMLFQPELFSRGSLGSLAGEERLFQIRAAAKHAVAHEQASVSVAQRAERNP